MRLHAYLYDRSSDIVSALQAQGIQHGVEVDLTADQVLSLTENFSVMVHKVAENGVRLLCIDNPRWNFKQR